MFIEFIYRDGCLDAKFVQAGKKCIYNFSSCLKKTTKKVTIRLIA